MSHARCFAEPGSWRDGEVTLSADVSHHLLDVLRAREGDTVTVFDGAGRTAGARITSAAPGAVLLRVGESVQHTTPAIPVTLFLAVIREQRMDFAIQKATELGAWRIVPLMCARSVVRIAPNRRAERLARWQRIADNAAGQCGTPWTPRVEPMISPAEIGGVAAKISVTIVASLEPDAKPLRDILSEQAAKRCKSAGFIVGPEGDFTPDEMSAIRKAGVLPASLGDLVLRSETAALYVMSAAKYAFGL